MKTHTGHKPFGGGRVASRVDVEAQAGLYRDIIRKLVLIGEFKTGFHVAAHRSTVEITVKQTALRRRAAAHSKAELTIGTILDKAFRQKSGAPAILGLLGPRARSR
jgi:hypothetical protein